MKSVTAADLFLIMWRWLLLLCVSVSCSPFWDLNDKLQRLSGDVSLQRSSIPGKELGVFVENPVAAFSSCLHITHEDWIDPYGMLHMKASDLVAGSIQEQVWKELLIGRKGSGNPLLVILKQIPGSSPSFLSVLLLRFLNSPSSSTPLYPWLQLLPKDQHGTLMWTDDELSLLQGSPVLETTKELKKTVIQAFTQLEAQIFSLHRDLFPTTQFTFARFAYAYQLILSRSFLIGTGETKRRVLVPLVDMFNHLPLPEETIIDTENPHANAIIHFDTLNNQLSIVPNRDLVKGEEIFINYGNLPVLNYGFVMGKANINNYYQLQVEYKSPFAMSVHLFDPVYDNVVTNPPPIFLNIYNVVGSLQLLRWERLCNLQITEMDHVMKVYYEDDVISIDNELKAIRASIQLLTEKIDQYTTTIEYDGDFLQSHPDLSLRSKTAIIHRYNEKKILRVAVGHLRAMWKYILDTGTISTPRELLDIPTKETEIISYSHTIPSNEQLILPKGVELHSTIWQSLLKMTQKKVKPTTTHQTDENAQKNSGPPNLPEPVKDSVIERAEYKPIIVDPPTVLRTFQPNDNGLVGGRMKIAILVASKVDREVENAYELPLVNILLQSIIATWSDIDLEYFFINFYIGFDTGDKFYDNESNMRNLRVAFDQLESTYPIKFRIICTGNTHNAPAHAWSLLGNIAYHDGNEYFFQVNDDVEMKCENWIFKFVTALQKTENYGVVGPIDPLRKLLTQAFVHRKHFQIFDPMYPEVFRNWYMDDWMELVYGKLASPVKECYAVNSPHPPRYEIDTEAHQHLTHELYYGCVAIQLFFLGNGHENHDKFYCTKISPTSSGPNQSVELNEKQYLLGSPHLPAPLLVDEIPLSVLLGKYSNEDNLIMITFTNWGFIDMTKNWLQNVELLKIPHYMVVCLDKTSYELLQKMNINSFYDEKYSTKSTAAEYLQGHYRELVNLKTLYNYRILSFGYHTLLCDNDIALLQNPFEHVGLNEYDIQIQDDSVKIDSFGSVNTGFQLVRSNHRTIQFYLQVYMLTQNNPELQDQRAYNYILQNTAFRHLLKWNVLDPVLYPNGWIYFVEQIPQSRNMTPVIIHNNWITGLQSKIHRFREQHLWLIDPQKYYSDPDARYLTYTNRNTDVQSYLEQTEELYDAIMLAKLLNRKLILPPFRVFSEGRTEIDFVTAEMLYKIELLHDVIELREHAFLTNPTHNQSEYSPLRDAQLIDLIETGSSPCYSVGSCFQRGHQGFIKFEKALSIESKTPLSVDEVQKSFGIHSNRHQVSLLVIPNIKGKVRNLDYSFDEEFLDKLNNAVTIKTAPHLQ